MGLLLKRKKNLNQATKSSTIKKDLVKIYKDENGNIPDISRLEVKKRSWLKTTLTLVTVVLVLIAGIAWLGFLIFGPPNGYRGESLEINILSEKNIASGDKVVYKISFKNKEDRALNNLELFIRYPQGFNFLSATPTPSNEFNSLWQLNSLAKGEKGEIEVAGKLVGEVGTIKNLDITIAFEPENFASTFKETKTFSQQITSSILEIELDGPALALPEKQVTYNVKYKNSSDQTLENVKLQILYPVNFVFQSAEPAPYQGEEDEIARVLDNVWIFKELESQSEGEIAITGGYVADEDEEKDFIVQIGFLDEEKDFALQQEQKLTTKIIKQKLSLDLIVNGSSTDSPANFGQTLNYLIAYKNLGQNLLEDVVIEVEIVSDLVDWETLSGKNLGKLSEEENKITWSKEEIDGLEIVESLEEGQIEFSLKLKDFDIVDIDEISLETKNLVTAKIAKIDEIVADVQVASNEIKNIINTELQISAAGRYFTEDNMAVGTGPLPPVVGQRTAYRIYWAIANSLNEVEDVQISTTLPQGVDFANKFLVNAGKLDYQKESKTVKWNIGKISANKTFDDVNLWFDIEVIPSSEQKGKILVLTTQTNLSATDVSTEDEVNKSAAAITSNLEQDSIAKGKGIVVGIE